VIISVERAKERRRDGQIAVGCRRAGASRSRAHSCLARRRTQRLLRRHCLRTLFAHFAHRHLTSAPLHLHARTTARTAQTRSARALRWRLRHRACGTSVFVRRWDTLWRLWEKQSICDMASCGCGGTSARAAWTGSAPGAPDSLASGRIRQDAGAVKNGDVRHGVLKSQQNYLLCAPAHRINALLRRRVERTSGEGMGRRRVIVSGDASVPLLRASPRAPCHASCLRTCAARSPRSRRLPCARVRCAYAYRITRLYGAHARSFPPRASAFIRIAYRGGLRAAKMVAKTAGRARSATCRRQQYVMKYNRKLRYIIWRHQRYRKAKPCSIWRGAIRHEHIRQQHLSKRVK